MLHKSPPLRGDLMKLRVKDLQHFLSKRQINIKACVGKSSQPPLIVRPWYLTGSKKQLRSPLRPPLCWLFFHQEALPLSQGARNRISNCCRRSVNWLSTYFSLDLRLEMATTVPEIVQIIQSNFQLVCCSATVTVSLISWNSCVFNKLLITWAPASSRRCFSNFPKQLFIGNFHCGTVHKVWNPIWTLVFPVPSSGNNIMAAQSSNAWSLSSFGCWACRTRREGETSSLHSSGQKVAEGQARHCCTSANHPPHCTFAL